MIYKNRGDGWDLDEIYPLAEVVEYAEDVITKIAYELENCGGSMTLQEIQDELISAAKDLIKAVESINDNDLIEVGLKVE